MPYLEIKLGPDTMLLRFVGRIDYVIGRLPRSDVQVRDMKVSRLHTQVFIDSRGFAWARDLGSSIGTFVNNQKLRPHTFAPMLGGTQLRIGDAVVSFREEEPPPEAIDPPGASAPRGLIRTSARTRNFAADITVLELDQAAPPPTRDGPAEPPPEVKLGDFTGENKDETNRQPAAPKGSKKRRDSAIVEAPWDKPGGSRPKVGKKVTVRVPPRPGAMPSAEFDEHGHYLPDKPKSQTAQRMGPMKKVPPIPVPGQTPAPATESFKPPPPIQGDMPVEDESTRAPKLPTVRLDKSELEERMRAQEDEPPPNIPSVHVTADGDVDLGESVAPRIGMEPGTTPVDIISEAEFEEDVEFPDEEDLTDEQVVDQLGGRQDYGDVNFGDGSEEEEADEAVFGAAKARLEGDEAIDIESPTPAPTDSGSHSRDGATMDRTFKPRKTRKLMKRRTASLDKTGRTFEQDMPEPGAKTVFVPRPDNAMLARGGTDESEDETNRSPNLDENIESKTLDDLAQGPGGDTVALPGPMLSDLRADLSADAARGRQKLRARPTDLLAEVDKLPKDKRAGIPDEPDTLVE
jgi:hypothetical protein